MSGVNTDTAVEKLRAMVAWFNASNESANDLIKNVAAAERLYDVMKTSGWDVYMHEFPNAVVRAAVRPGGHAAAVQLLDEWMYEDGCKHCYR